MENIDSAIRLQRSALRSRNEARRARFVAIRLYTEIEGKADKVPTKKGVALRPDLIPELIEALEGVLADPGQPGEGQGV